MLYQINGKVYDTRISELTPAPVLEVLSPVRLWSDWTPVVTATTALQSSVINIPAPVVLKTLSIVPSADATANGLSVCVIITDGAGNITQIPASAQPVLNGLKNISAIFNLSIDPPYGQPITANQATITLFYAAIGGSSTLQLVVTGFYIGNPNGYPNGVS